MDDLISRQAAITEIEKYTMTSGVRNQGTWNECVSVISETISELPHAEPNKHLWFMVGETLVSESKRHITAEQAIERIRQYMQEAQLPPAQQWIPCSERLPGYGNVVIVSVLDTSGDTTFDYTATGWIAPSGDFWVVDGELCSGIIAWQPLPEPYREESNDKS